MVTTTIGAPRSVDTNGDQAMKKMIDLTTVIAAAGLLFTIGAHFRWW
ncbi:hypothetical protein GGR16_002395 [Chelatococcus caeni]|uniref:Uncharacterized protein n=1 Tax=Chelatococcus caeni TaxID=1348468 RepID=A0A840C365_9HYPH|nr:hypothetical protein [Chelatococcus caeni]MBB4017366.1 hypothetical protein [Chelatococcus caeni]